jgi:hypothetical protein
MNLNFTIYISVYATYIIIGICIVYFFYIHVCFIISNKTTIDYLEKQSSANIYNVGIYRNVCQVFGPIALWLIPINYTYDKGNGYTFDIVDNKCDDVI